MSTELWKSWRRLTRLLESGSAAFASERQRIEELGTPHERILISAGTGRYVVTHQQHSRALADETIFHGAILTQFYALTEATALDALQPPGEQLTGGIRAWAGALLKREDKALADVCCKPAPNLHLWQPGSAVDPATGFMDGSLALLEVALIRNLIAHNGYRVNQTALNSLKDGGREPAVTLDQQLELTLGDTRNLKGRLATLLNVASFQVDDDAYRPPRGAV